MAAERGIEVIESRSTRARNYTNLISVKLETSGGSRKVEGAVFEQTPPRLVLLDGIAVEAPLDGTMIVMCNTDQPGVIGEVGTVLGRHGVNIATFALGREGDRAIGVVIVDETRRFRMRAAELRRYRRARGAAGQGLEFASPRSQDSERSQGSDLVRPECEF